MNKLRYSHARALSLAEVVYVWLYRTIYHWAGTSLPGGPRGQRGRRILLAAAVVLTLVCEFVMLWMLAELIDLCISLMELWTVLARKHLELTLDKT